MKEKTMPLEIRQALVHDGDLLVVTACGRLFREMESGGWWEVDPPRQPMPAWLRDMEGAEEPGVES